MIGQYLNTRKHGQLCIFSVHKYYLIRKLQFTKMEDCLKNVVFSKSEYANYLSDTKWCLRSNEDVVCVWKEDAAILCNTTTVSNVHFCFKIFLLKHKAIKIKLTVKSWSN